MVLMGHLKWMKKEIMNKLIIDNLSQELDNFNGQVVLLEKNVSINIVNNCQLDIIDSDCENINLCLLDNSSLQLNLYNDNPNNDLKINIIQNNKTNLKIVIVYECQYNVKLSIIDEVKGNDNLSNIIIKGYITKNNLLVLEQINALKGSNNNEATEEVKGMLNGGNLTVIPNMEIETSNIVANHLVTMTSFNPQYLFYLMSKGISEKEAKQLIKNGFILSDLDDNLKSLINKGAYNA